MRSFHVGVVWHPHLAEHFQALLSEWYTVSLPSAGLFFGLFSLQNMFFYSLVYDATQRTLVEETGEIRVGPKYQAVIPDLITDGQLLFVCIHKYSFSGSIVSLLLLLLLVSDSQLFHWLHLLNLFFVKLLTVCCFFLSRKQPGHALCLFALLILKFLMVWQAMCLCMCFGWTDQRRKRRPIPGRLRVIRCGCQTAFLPLKSTSSWCLPGEGRSGFCSCCVRFIGF